MPARLKIRSTTFTADAGVIAAVNPPRIPGTLHARTGAAAKAKRARPLVVDTPALTMEKTPVDPVPQAYRDLQRGLQDTDRGAEVGRTYRRLKR